MPNYEHQPVLIYSIEVERRLEKENLIPCLRCDCDIRWCDDKGQYVKADKVTVTKGEVKYIR